MRVVLPPSPCPRLSLPFWARNVLRGGAQRRATDDEVLRVRLPARRHDQGNLTGVCDVISRRLYDQAPETDNISPQQAV